MTITPTPPANRFQQSPAAHLRHSGAAGEA